MWDCLPAFWRERHRQMKKFTALAYLTALTVLSGCPLEQAKQQTLTSSDGKYSLAVQGGKFEDKLSQKVQIAAERLPGTPAENLTMLAEPADSKALVYGMTVPLPPGFKMTIEQVAQGMQKKVGQSTQARGGKTESLPVKDGYGRFLLSVNNRINETIAHEVCLVSLKDTYLIVCIVTPGETEQTWVKPALTAMNYH